MADWVIIRRRRRDIRSATTPAGSMKNQTGMPAAKPT